MQPIRIQSSQAKKKKKHPPPKTRVAKYGRPLKQGNTALSRVEKVARMHQSVKRKFADGVLLSTPTKRREWSGAVRLLVEVFSCCSLLTYVILVQMRIKVDRCTDVLLQESGGSPEIMSQLVANVNSQRVMKPFLPVGDDSPTMRFGKNVVATLNVCKKYSRKAGSGPDLLRRVLVAAGAEGPLSTNSMTLRDLARICGYGNNHMRLRGLYECKKKSNTIVQLVENPTFKGVQKQRRDRISGHPIWCRCWHQFTSVKKGQQFRFANYQN